MQFTATFTNWTDGSTVATCPLRLSDLLARKIPDAPEELLEMDLSDLEVTIRINGATILAADCRAVRGVVQLTEINQTHDAAWTLLNALPQ